MKPLTSSLFHFIGLSICVFLFSCDRAVESKSTHVVLMLPNQQSLSKFISNITQLSTLGYATSSGGAANAFIPPLDSAAGSTSPVDLPAYCYLVTVSYDSSEDAKNINYCGETVTENLTNLDGSTSSNTYIKRSFAFSANFAGLVSSSNSIIDLGEVPAGKNRTFSVVGLRATDESACQLLKFVPFDKARLEAPRIIASQPGVDLTPGGEIDVTLKINLATDAQTTYFDDCVIQDAPIDYPVAKILSMEQENFPYEILRADNTEAVCQPITFALKAFDTSYNHVVPAALEQPIAYSVMETTGGGSFSSKTLLSTFNSYENCVDGGSGKDGFYFPRNKPYHKRWIKLNPRSTIPGETTISIFERPDYSGIAAIGLISPAKTFSVISGAYTKVFDHVIPKKLQKGACYKASTLIRDVSGRVTNYSGAIALSTAAVYPYMEVFGTAADCSGDVSSTTIISIDSGASFVDYWVKVRNDFSLSNGDTASIDFKLDYITTQPSLSPLVTSQRLFVGPNSLPSKEGEIDISHLGLSEGLTKLSIPNDPNVCYPLFLTINNRVGAAVAAPDPFNYDFYFRFDSSTVRNFRYIEMRYQPDQSASGAQDPGYTLYRGDSNYTYPSTDCSQSGNAILPVGDTGTPSGTAFLAWDGTYYRIFIKPNGSGTIGKRRIQFYYGGLNGTVGYPIGQVEVELTDYTK